MTGLSAVIGGLGIVIVDALDGRRAAGSPAETDAVLTVDADAVLAGAIPLQGFRRFPGGTRRSSRRPSISSWRNLRRATVAMFVTRRVPRPLASASVSASRNETIVANSNAARDHVKRG